MLMKAEQSTLLLIDVQEKLMPAISHGDEVVDRCIVLATRRRVLRQYGAYHGLVRSAGNVSRPRGGPTQGRHLLPLWAFQLWRSAHQ